MSSCRWTTLEELEGRSTEWRELLAASEFPNAFADPGWVLGWWRCYGEGHEPWCLIAEGDDGSLAAVAVLALRERPLMRTLTFAASEWNGLESLVSSPGTEASFADALLEALAERRSEWDIWRIRRLPSTTELARALVGRDARLRAAASDVRLQPFIELPASVEEFNARFTSKARNSRRSRARRLAELGASSRLLEDAQELPPAVHQLIELRTARAMEQNQDHEYMDARYERFLAMALGSMVPAAARLWMLELDGRALAIRLNLVAGPREHSYVQALSDEHRNLGPGASLEHQAIEAAIAQGRRELDLGPGREEYKYALGGIDRRAMRMIVPSRSSRAWLPAAAAALDVRLRASAVAEALRRRRGLAARR